MDRILSKLVLPKKLTTEMSSSDSDTSSNYSSSDEEVHQHFVCRLCNKDVKGSPEKGDENELCKPCQKDFPERMYCKRCKRYYPNGESFGKAKDRCNFCWRKLEKIREARKKRKEGVVTKETPDVAEKKKKKPKMNDIRTSAEKVIEKKLGEDTVKTEGETSTPNEGTFVAVFIKGTCVAKTDFEY